MSESNLSRRAFMATSCAALAVPASAQLGGAITRIVAPAGPGGTTDMLARLLASELGRSLGQTFVVENRPGAGTNIGNEYVARATPDGRTLLIITIAASINRALNNKLSFDPRTDFSHIGQLASVANAMLIGPALMQAGIASVAQFIDAAKANSTPYTFASVGNGSGLHLTGELLALQAGIRLQHIPYRSQPEAISSVLRGENHLMFDNVSSSLALVRERKLRALAVTSAARSRVMPEVPTMAESGVTNLVVPSWFGLSAPKNTPPDVIEKLERAVAVALQGTAAQKSITDQGMDVAFKDSRDFSNLIITETDRWAKVGEATGIKLE